MSWRHKSFEWLAAAVVVLASLAATAAVKPNPYEKIPERNVFNLQLIPQNFGPPVEKPVRRPLPKISITGLVEFRGVSKALVEVTEPGQPVQRSILAAGGSVGARQILDVDVTGERVHLPIDGIEETLSIEKPKPSTVAQPLRTSPMPPLPAMPARPRTVLRG